MTNRLTDKQKGEYLHRCYTAVDGLWFMMVEEAYDFETALDLDEKVWHIVPKIQARKLKQLLGQSDGLHGLYECLCAKLKMDEMEFTGVKDADGNGFIIRVDHCHWQEMLRKAGREHLQELIGSRICNAEYGTWAKEFGDDIEFELTGQRCKGQDCCVLRFRKA